MAQVEFHFRALAVEETQYWNLPPALAGSPVFGLYLFCEGEATHVCSLTPSSRIDFLRNAFLTDRADDPAAAEAYLQDGGDGEEYENGGEPSTYRAFIRDPEAPETAPYVSGRITVTLDSDDYEDSDEGRDAMRDDAWNEARESAEANHDDPPVIMSGFEYEAHCARKAR
ncbi:hypothetical protein KIKIMORA_04700 [Brevundimonas phage vB_BpoS-Kikimora]|uniref:Uncharacterized protein n=1 Tax=Brevundimonas phage vB_BpoS-Kikimora TaxID=2948601 RepID=A0A9E7MS00_9CAUD|nr:hypothetical protein KIKIMORA_04700 [Brevundimonas phage vB_BpoS-Kikimora]